MGFGDYLPNENIGIPRFLHIGRNPWLGDYASNGPSAINSRKNTGLGPQSDRIALITHNSTGLSPPNCQFAVISHNLPRFPANSNARMGNHPKQNRQRIKSRTPARIPALVPASAGTRQLNRHDTATSSRTPSKHRHTPTSASLTPLRAYIDAAVGSESNSARSLAISFCTLSKCCAVL